MKVNFYCILIFLIIGIFYNCNEFVVLAVLPTTISLVNSTNGYRISHANTIFSHGDVNGDGHDDLIGLEQNVGIFVYYGPLANNFQYQATRSMINGTNGFIYLNNKVPAIELAIGDINNDGFDDITFFINISPGQLGVIYGTNQIVSPASFSTLNGVNGFFILHTDTNNVAFGYVRSVIDFNGDSIKDLFVSTSSGTLGSGNSIAYMLFGINGGKFPVNAQFAFDPSTFNGTNGFVLNGLEALISLPYDLNNDGIGDIIVNRQQTALYVIYGRRGTFTSPYVPVYDGVQGSIFNFNGYSIISNRESYGYGDFNQDGLNDLAVFLQFSSFGGKYFVLILYGKTQYPATKTLGLNLDKSDGLIIIDSKTAPSGNTWGTSVKLSDINNDGVADLLIGGAAGMFVTVLFGNNMYGINNTVYLNEIAQSGTCSYYSVFGFTSQSFTDFGDYNSDGINDITGEGMVTIYGESYIGSISIINLLFPFNSLSNLNYKLFENNINSVSGLCAISKVTLTIENSIIGDQFIIDDSYDSTFYSITPNSNNTKLIILLLIKDESKSIANQVLNKISVSLTPQILNRTVTLVYGSNKIQSITIIGAPNANCEGKCLNGGTCNDINGCQCTNDFYGNYCEIKDCTVNCLNGGSCNSTIGECSCINDFYGNNCGTKDCTVNCLNGGSCDTTIGECLCTNGYEGTGCSGISCSSQCLNGAACNTTIGECLCINDFYGNNCGKMNCTSNCLNGGSCDTTTGKCLCTTGYEGIDCSGISCTVSCLNDGVCDNTVGKCICNDDYEGDDCSNKKNKKTNIGIIVGPIIGGVALIAIIIAAVILIKKKKNNKEKKPNIELKTQASTVGVFYGGQINKIDKF